MNSRKERGFILHTAVVIAVLTMLWAVAAVYRVNNQTGASLHSYQKSEAYYLAKQAASRSLAFMNADASWLDLHNSQASADITTEGAKAWAEKSGTVITLMVEAKVGNQRRQLKVPILDDSSDSSKIFSLSPSANGGPDVISWATTLDGDWKGLPPVPGAKDIISTATSKSGDVFACTSGPNGGMLWRYRTGQGWMQMPDLPANVELSQLSCNGDSRLVGKGSDNTIMKLPLATDSDTAMMWKSVPAPSNNSLQVVEADPSGADRTFVTSTEGSDAKIWLLDGSTWKAQTKPAGVSNLDGGLTVDSEGKVYVAANGQPATIYVRDSDSAGLSPSDWKPINSAMGPPGSVPAIEWLGASAQNPSGFIQNIVNIESDPADGSLWVQWDNPGGSTAHNMVQVPTQ